MTPRALARYAERAYAASPMFAASGVEIVRFTVAAPGGGNVVYAFRGTEHDYRDILTDLRGVPWPDPWLGWCHSGFLKGVRAVWPRLSRALARETAPVWFCGHSKGGAEATISAALTTMLIGAPAGLATFGAPRVGFARLAEVLDGVESRRYVRGRDAVPDHPSRVWGYAHVGPEIAIGTARHRWEDHRVAGYVDDMPA